MLVVLSILIIHAIAKGNCDRKAFKEGGVEPSDGKGWLKKVPLSFLLGKWHRWDAIRVLAVCTVIALYLDNIYLAIPLYIAHGIIFEITYNIKHNG